LFWSRLTVISMFSFDGIKVVSYFPGRVRLRIEKLKHNPAFAEQIQNSLAGLDGIKKLEVKQETGSVLVAYDKKRIKQPENSQALIATLNELFPELNSDKLKKLLGI
jgi:hypothetical protein